MDDLAFEFFNILLPASEVEKTIDDIRDVISVGDVDTEVEDNILKAELYIANISQQIVPLNIKILSNISKIVFERLYSWAGKLRRNSKPHLDNMIKNISAGWDKSLRDEELRLDIMTYAYHSILKIKPFFDGNEKVARLFTNYLALKYSLHLFTIAPSKDDKTSYKRYCRDLRLADRGDLSRLRERIRDVLYISGDDLTSLKLGPAGSVSSRL